MALFGFRGFPPVRTAKYMKDMGKFIIMFFFLLHSFLGGGGGGLNIAVREAWEEDKW